MFVPLDTAENVMQSSLNSVMYLLFIILYPYFVVMLARVIVRLLNVVWIRRIIINN